MVTHLAVFGNICSSTYLSKGQGGIVKTCPFTPQKAFFGRQRAKGASAAFHSVKAWAEKVCYCIDSDCDLPLLRAVRCRLTAAHMHYNIYAAEMPATSKIILDKWCAGLYNIAN